MSENEKRFLKLAKEIKPPKKFRFPRKMKKKRKKIGLSTDLRLLRFFNTVGYMLKMAALAYILVKQEKQENETKNL